VARDAAERRGAARLPAGAGAGGADADFALLSVRPRRAAAAAATNRAIRASLAVYNN